MTRLMSIWSEAKRLSQPFGLRTLMGCLTADKREIKDFPKLSSATSFIRKNVRRNNAKREELQMKKWYKEDWRFKITVIRVGKENKAEECRLGFESGDMFESTYETPAGFCPKSMLKIFPVLEAVRSGGDLRNLGGSGPHEMTLVCPDGVVQFKVTGKRVTE